MVVIQFRDVTKYFQIYTNKPLGLKDRFVKMVTGHNKTEILRRIVLANASFAINQGETVGIIGENGAGKSTILKLIAGILQPNAGPISVQGSVSALLEIGAGFQPELSGRENVFLYGSILGLPRSEISARYDDIVEFAEIGDYMEMPVKNYSSGMYMRLAFAVAVHVDPDILLVDEVLAVGDEAFQAKCIRKIQEFRSKGKTIVFVSHDMTAVKRLCDRVIWVERNGSIHLCQPDEAVAMYLGSVYKPETLIDAAADTEAEAMKPVFSGEGPHLAIDNPETSRWGNRFVQIDRCYFMASTGQVCDVFRPGEDLHIMVEYTAGAPVDRAVLGIAVYTDEGVHLAGPNSKVDGIVFTDLNGRGRLRVTLKELPLLAGRYLVTAALYDFECVTPFDHREKHYAFTVANVGDQGYGRIRLACAWSTE